MVLTNKLPQEQVFWHYSIPFIIQISVQSFFDYQKLVRRQFSEETISLVSTSINQAFLGKRFVGGHLTLNDYKSVSSSIGYHDPSYHFFVLRDPFDRVVSYWEFCQRQKEHVHKTSMSFIDALRSDFGFFRACTWEQNYYVSGKNSFEESKKTIETNKCMIVTTDHLYVIVSKINRLLGLTEKINVSTDGPRLNVNPNSNYAENYYLFREELKPLIQQDQLLFDYVKSNSGVVSSI